MPGETIAAAVDAKGRTMVSVTDRDNWSEVVLVDQESNTVSSVWQGQVDALTALQRYEDDSHPNFRPFRYIGQ